MSEGRTICITTGSRADYGLLRPVMRAVRARDGLRLQVVATGMHLSRRYGHTADRIAEDGFAIDAEVPVLDDDPPEAAVPGDSAPAAARVETPLATARAIGRGVTRLAECYARLAPDVILLLGDRSEIFAAAAAAAPLNIAIAHVHGGDRTRGGLDESLRHAITKLAHVHLPATAQSARRVIQLGERAEHVHAVGAPGLDELLAAPRAGREAIERALGHALPDPFLLLVQHPVSTRPAEAARDTEEILAAVRDAGAAVAATVALGPNSDAGAAAVRERLAREDAGRDTFHFHESLPRDVYLGLIEGCAALVGNSSSGIVEAPSLGAVAVNVGSRQDGRERAENVIDVSPQRREIGRAIGRAIGDPELRARVARRHSPYGDGHAAERIVAALEELVIDTDLLQKQFVDRPPTCREPTGPTGAETEVDDSEVDDSEVDDSEVDDSGTCGDGPSAEGGFREERPCATS